MSQHSWPNEKVLMFEEINFWSVIILIPEARFYGYWQWSERVKVFVTQLCPTLGEPRECSTPGASVRGIIYAKIPEWVAISLSRWAFRQRDSALQVDSLLSEPPGKPTVKWNKLKTAEFEADKVSLQCHARRWVLSARNPSRASTKHF